MLLSQRQITPLPPQIDQLLEREDFYAFSEQFPLLTPELGQSSNLTELYLHGNEDLNIPVEILGPTWQRVQDNGANPAKPKDILEYYFQIQSDLQVQSEPQPLNEAKLILVGFGAVGKTSLVNRFIYNKFDPGSKKTEGIQITPWKLSLNTNEDITLNVWDFGGQEIMHSTHQFFLTERSLYILVLNGRKGQEDKDAEYWLGMIKSFGGNSPIIVVLNKIKDHPFDVNQGDLRQKFKNIRAFVKTDCEGNTPTGINQLIAIIERETNNLDDVRIPFPTSWFGIKQKLATMSENYISFEKYREICEQNNEIDHSKQEFLASYLHSLGTVLNYRTDPRLRDTHVLNPHWVTNGIYTLLNSHEVTETKGELRINRLGEILDSNEYPSERHGFLLELMNKFELCFRFQEDENRYLIPDLLGKQQPSKAEEFSLTDCLNFRYSYPILPEGILPRFIVRTHILSEQKLRWRTGVILNFEGNRALIKANRQDRCITISINGPNSSRRRLLAIIRSDFERIHRSFKFNPEELIPVPYYPNIEISYQELMALEEAGELSLKKYSKEAGLLTLNIKDLLNGVDIEGSRKKTDRQARQSGERRTDALHLFYSYAHKDETLREELETHLKILERQGLIRPWHDRSILAGKEWTEEIASNLKQANIVLLLISADFIASDYCYKTELEIVLEKQKQGKAKVIPIILRPTDWESTPFSHLQALPTNAKAVTTWDNKDSAWLNVETGIKNAIEAFKAKRT